MELFIAEPHGMCTGVARALRIVRRTLEEHPGEPLWCFHEIVHNEHVVSNLRAQGVRFVNDLADVPPGSRLLFSAHGVSPAVRAQAAERNLEVVDATCPFVAKVHAEAKAFAAQALPIALVGHKGHDEVVGILGEAPTAIRVIETAADVAALRQELPAVRDLALLSQTTVSGEMFNERLADLRAAGFTPRHPNHRDICYATQERQDAVRELAGRVDRLLVLGSRTSSNSKRLAEVAQTAGCPATLIASPDELDTLDLSGVERLGLTSGASTPEELLTEVAHRLSPHA
ncbi:MAG: 4-hydroxy-3-methylbut-2-enyl diphosphate reductase [Lentisphaeraceae bacterium]|nr:4-hydroxy-3-methylbut-2-enyl diphosphate reductase [Lentisphaeraceae bacterium]